MARVKGGVELGPPELGRMMGKNDEGASESFGVPQPLKKGGR